MILGSSPASQRQPLVLAAAGGGTKAPLPAAPPLPAGGVHLSDVQRTLTLFTQGLAGRYLHLKAAEPAPEAEGGNKKTYGTQDHAALYLPEAMSSFDNARHNIGAYRIAVLHQLGFFECGTYGFRLAGAQARLPGLPEEKYSWEMSRAPDLERFFGLWPAPVLMRQVFMTLEGLRIDVAMRRRYPGARADLARVLAQALASRPDRAELPLFASLLEGLVQYSLGADRAELLIDDASGMLQAILDAAAAVESAGANVYECARAAVACYGSLERAGLPRKAVVAPDGATHLIESGEGEPGDGQSGPVDEDALRARDVDFRGEPNPEFIDDEYMDADGPLTEDMSNMVGNAYGATPLPTPEEREERKGRVKGVAVNTEEALAQGVRTYLYDEWNYRSQSWLKGWCRLFEYRLKGDDPDFIRDVRRRHAVLAHQVRRRFQFIRPESRQRVRRVSDGEELELDGIIEAIIDRRAGSATDEHVYMRRDRALRDVAAAFLIDMSASTGIAVPDKDAPPKPKEDEDDYPMHLWSMKDAQPEPYVPAAPKRTVIDVAKESLVLMCDALETLGDAYAIYGFSGDGREQVDFHVAKTFEDRLSARTWSALAAMKPQRSTRMGPAIRHALTKLARQSTRMKVLIIVSDGYPQDKDYGPDRMDDEYGIQDTAAALREAEREGVQTFCMTIDPAGYDYLKRMCAADRYMVIDDVADLPAALTKVYRALTV